MAIEILVAGVNRSDKRLASAPLSWSDLLNGRGTLSVTFRDVVGGFRPQDGQEILVVDDSQRPLNTSDGAAIQTSDLAAVIAGADRLFGGHLFEPEEREELGTGMLFFECSAVEFSAIADRRLVARLYEGVTLDSIVRDIVARDLDAEGLDLDGVESGPLIEKAVFADRTITEAFNELAELTGRTWRIDAYKTLHFRTRLSLVAPLPLDGDTLMAGSIRVRRDRERYRNTQVIRAGTDLTDQRSDTLVGDGERRVFGTAFPIGAVPTVAVSRGGGAFTDETVGILGIETGRAWFWNVGLAQITQDDSGTVLAAPTTPGNPATGDRIRVTYRGIFPIKTQFVDSAEITARQAIEGGSGVYANVEDRPQINSAQSAIDATVALIERFGKVGTIVEGRSRLAVFAPGQIATVNLPNHGLTGEQMLIESVSAEYVSEVGEVWYTVRAMSGDPFGGWQEYFRRLLQGGRSLVIEREGEILVLVRVIQAPVDCGGTATVATQAPESRIGIMEIGTGEIGAAA